MSLPVRPSPQHGRSPEPQQPTFSIDFTKSSSHTRPNGNLDSSNTSTSSLTDIDTMSPAEATPSANGTTKKRRSPNEDSDYESASARSKRAKVGARTKTTKSEKSGANGTVTKKPVKKAVKKPATTPKAPAKSKKITTTLDGSEMTNESTALSDAPKIEKDATPDVPTEDMPTPDIPQPTIEDSATPDNPKPTVEHGAAPSSSRPSRIRKAPERLEAYREPEKPKKTPYKPVSKVFDPEYLLTHAKSRLARADLAKLLDEAAAWDVLGPKDQDEILARLPGSVANTKLRAQLVDGASGVERPKDLRVMGRTVLLADIGKLGRDLANGYYAKGWQREAHQAMIARAEGKFDVWKAQESERWWGQNME